MPLFSATMTTVGTTYQSSADATVPFEPRVLRLQNTDGVVKAFVRVGSSGGDHVELGPGESTVLEDFASPGSYGALGVFSGVDVFTRAPSGTPVVKLRAES